MGGVMRRWLPVLVALAIVAVGGLFAWRAVERALAGPDPETVVLASLDAVRAQNVLVPFQARYVAVVTSTQRRFGLSAQRTTIMPGTVRYELDLARLQQRDLAWDPVAATLTVTLPPIVPSRPEIELEGLRSYDGGGVLMALTDAGQRLDAANRVAAQAQLVAQARGAVPMRLARDAAREAVERSFALPLRAAGVQAEVRARFADDPGGAPERMDRSRSVREVLGSR